MDLLCLDCDEQFGEHDAEIVSYGSGAVLSKTELFACPSCGSINLKDKDTGKIQGI